jgi:DNA polymerase III gamma/tau subunit
MSTDITLSLSDQVIQGAQVLASGSNRDLQSVLEGTLETAIRSLKPDEIERRLAAMTDHEVLELADATMPPARSRRLAALNERQKITRLAPMESAELAGLIQEYAVGNLWKAHGLKEAVRRGLRERLAS